MIIEESETSIKAYKTPIKEILFVVFVEVLLGLVIFGLLTYTDAFILVAGFSFFFIVTATAIPPLLNKSKKGNNILIWGITNKEFETINMTTTRNEFCKPIKYEWNEIIEVIFVEKLKCHDPEEPSKTSILNDRILFVISDLKLPNNILFNFVKSYYSTPNKGYYKILETPRKETLSVYQKIKELSPNKTLFKELEYFEI